IRKQSETMKNKEIARTQSPPMPEQNRPATNTPPNTSSTTDKQIDELISRIRVLEHANTALTARVHALETEMKALQAHPMGSPQQQVQQNVPPQHTLAQTTQNNGPQNSAHTSHNTQTQRPAEAPAQRPKQETKLDDSFSLNKIFYAGKK